MIVNDDLYRLVSEYSDVQALVQGLNEIKTFIWGSVDVWHIEVAKLHRLHCSLCVEQLRFDLGLRCPDRRLEQAILVHAYRFSHVASLNFFLGLFVFEAVNDTLEAWLHVLADILQVKFYSYDQCFRDYVWCMHEAVVADTFKYVPREDMVPRAIELL